MIYNPQLKTFIAVCDAGSFSKAAEKLYITPTAVIKQINLLEESMHVRLFERTNHGVVLTGAGRSFCKDARKIMAWSDEAVKRAQSIYNGEGQRVIRIGSSPITPVQPFLECWDQIQKEDPELTFHIVPFQNTPENAREILGNLGTKIDVVPGIFDEQLLKYRHCLGEELYRIPLELAVPRSNPLYEKKRIEMKDLYGQHVMLLREGSFNEVDRLRKDLMLEYPQIAVETFPFYCTEVFNQCEDRSWLLMSIAYWRDVHPLLRVIPVQWEYQIPYGILYAREPLPVVNRLLNAIRKTKHLKSESISR